MQCGLSRFVKFFVFSREKSQCSGALADGMMVLCCVPLTARCESLPGTKGLISICHPLYSTKGSRGDVSGTSLADGDGNLRISSTAAMARHNVGNRLRFPETYRIIPATPGLERKQYIHTSRDGENRLSTYTEDAPSYLYRKSVSAPT